MRLVFLLIFLTNTTLAFTQNGTQPILVTDMLKIRSLSNADLSRDGKSAVFNVTSIEPEGDSKTEYRYSNQVWYVTTDGNSEPRQLTFKENSTQPVLSPDGRQVAFVRSIDNKPQIFLISLSGGEARQLTTSKYGAAAPRWSPDGSRIVFSANVPLRDILKDSSLNGGRALPSWPFERPGYDSNANLRATTAKPNPDGSVDEVRAYLETNVTDKKARVITKLSFQDEMDINPDLNFNKLFIIDVNKPNEPRLLTPGFYRFGFADFSPDGKKIFLTGNMDSLQHPDRSLESEIYTINTDGSGLKKLFGSKGETFFGVSVSPSGKKIALQRGTTAFVTIPKLVIASLDGGDLTEIPFDRNKGNLVWSDDEKWIYFTSQSNGGSPIYRADISSKKVEQLTDYNSGTSAFDMAGDKMIFAKTEVANPFELYIADRNAKNQKKISRFNSEWLANKKLSFPEKHEFTNDKGLRVEYWVMKPTNYEQGKKYPLLLEIHGGPASMWGPGEASMWHEYQYFCSKGYGVVYSNPRGSSGYGQEFLRSNINDWGAGPTRDVLKSLDMTIAEGWADTSKLVITGGSYAGYLVSWIIAHDQRFKAACVQRGVYDLATFFGEGNAWRLVPGYFGGYPWEAEVKATLQRESPISYVQNIRTPLIIFHGENDRRTGFVQSEMLYRNLKALDRPVEYVRHPGATHEITRSGNNRQRIDQMLRTWEFFERWIR